MSFLYHLSRGFRAPVFLAADKTPTGAEGTLKQQLEQAQASLAEKTGELTKAEARAELAESDLETTKASLKDALENAETAKGKVTALEKEKADLQAEVTKLQAAEKTVAGKAAEQLAAAGLPKGPTKEAAAEAAANGSAAGVPRTQEEFFAAYNGITNLKEQTDFWAKYNHLIGK